MIVIVNYNMGNLGSIANMFKKIGYSSLISSDKYEIEKAEKIILPGVGAFDHGITNLQKLNLMEVLEIKAKSEKTPILGICLGMQLMCKSSEEGKLPGLSWIDGDLTKFNKPDLKVPHMGWNVIEHKKDSILFNELSSEKRYYFVHSYKLNCRNQDDILTTTNYGTEFVSSFERDNLYGVQFHPEKSHNFGMQLLKNFIEKT